MDSTQECTPDIDISHSWLFNLSNMAEMKGDDPFDWEIDRVVQELCTSNRSWIPTPRAKLPGPEALAQKLRDGEYDGETLLATPENDLWKDLGITKAKYKVNIRHALGQFTSRSPKYKKYLAFINDQDVNIDSDNDTTGTLHQAFTPVSDAGVPAVAPTTTQPAETIQNDGQTMQMDEHPDEPPKKKKRLAVSAMTTNPRSSIANQPSNIATLPNYAEINTYALDEAAQVPPEDSDMDAMDIKQCESSSRAYWGNGKLPKSGVFEASISTNDDVSFGWGTPTSIGKAKKKYVADRMKRYLRRPKQEFDTEDNKILPLYGQSDDEEDCSEWDEIVETVQREELEDAEEADEEADEVLGLLASEVDNLLKQMVEECATNWHEQQLPKEKHKAYKIWDDTRKRGTRGSTVKEMTTELWKGRTRLEKTLAEMKANYYQTGSELRGMSDFLKPDVNKIEHIKWLISVVNSPEAPERVSKLKSPSQRKRKTKRTREIDLWSGDEQEEEMDDFIVEDSYDEADPQERPQEPREAEAFDMDHTVSNTPLDPAQSFGSSTTEDIEMHDLTQIDDSPFRGRDYALIDLVTPSKPKREPATPRASAKGTTYSASPASERFPLSDPKSIANMGTLHWEERKDFERLIVTILSNLHKARQNDIFDNIIILQGEDDPVGSLRKEYVDFACEHCKSSTDVVRGSREKNRYETAATLTRLFAIYLNKYSASASESMNLSPKCKKLDADHIGRVKAGIGHLPEFWALLKTIAPSFGYTQEADESLSADDEELGSDSTEMASVAQPKQAPAGSSQNVREKEKRRQKEQQQRRLLLRQQVQGSQLSHEKSRLIINESKLEGHNLVYVHDYIAGRIKDHQIDGVRFMWDQILSDANQGCLLAHAMGLGKTMQVVTLLTAIQEAAKSEDPKVSCQIPDNLKESRTLILCPAGLLNNWMDELLLWAPDEILGTLLSVTAIMSEEERTDNIQEWADEGGVLVIGYTMLTQIAKREDLLTLILESPSIVVGDEAHNLKNDKSQRSSIANRFRTHTRLALTGSPLANNVDEYYAMIQWVAPGFLGEKRWFRSEYSNPIANGLYEDSSRTDRRRAKIRLAALRKVVAPKMHRRTVGTLKDSLPPKTEYIVYLDMRNVQKAVYLTYLNVVNGAGVDQVPLMWALIRTLGLLLAHPLVLERVLKQKLQDSIQSSSKKAARNDGGEEDSFAALPHQIVSTTLDALTAQHEYADLNSSFKMLALFKIIEETTKLEENLLVFSQSLPSLNFIEKICRQKRIAYQRLDGKTDVNKRQDQVKRFNEGKGQVYLISTTAGGVGLNIYGASRVVIFDFQHSPVHEQQAIGRAYRIGQTKPVIVYWLIYDGTFEKALHNQQVFKNQLASRVVDKKDPLPKATILRQYFAEPQQVEHQNTSAYFGQDAILDTLLLSDEIREGISSISTTETFEEEDTQKLEADEIAAAEELVQQISRKINAAEDNLAGMPSQPWEQIRDIPGLLPSDSVGFAPALSPLHFQQSQAFGPASAFTAASIPGSVVTALAMPDYRTDSSQPLLASCPTEHESRANETGTNSLMQMMPVTTAPLPTGIRQHNFSRPDGVDRNESGYTQYHYQNANGLVGADTLRNESAPRVLPRDDPFVDFDRSHPMLGAERAQSLARTAAESGIMPVTMDAVQSRSAQMALADIEHASVSQDMVPVAMGGIQKRSIPSAAGQDSIASRESMKPIGLAPMISRPSGPSATKVDAMADFQKELTKQASYPLKQRVPALVEQVNKYIKGGALLRSSTWNKLKMLVQGRQDRADRVLDGNVSPQALATAGDPKAGLENLLDGRRSVPQSQGDKGTKDPDVGNPH